MRQFIAILKDSIREARNGWILQITVLVTIVALLIILSVSFKQMTVKEQLEGGFDFFNSMIKGNPELGTTSMTIENFKESKPETPWDSDHEFDFIFKSNTEEEFKKAKKRIELPGNLYRAQQMMKGGLKELKNVVVTQTVKDPDKHVYHVAAKGTNAPDQMSWGHAPRFLAFKEFKILTTSLRSFVYFIESYVIGGFGAWVILIIAVLITSFFIPNMLHKGTVDLFISKPINRPTLLIYKYLGGLFFIFLITSILIGTVWLVYAIRYGFWSPYLLLSIPILTFYFGILYAISTLIGTVTRSAIVSILVTLFLWFCFFLIGKVNFAIEQRIYDEEHPEKFAERQKEFRPIPDPDDEDNKNNKIEFKLDPESPLWGFIPKSFFKPIQALHYITPRTYELDLLLDREIARGVLSEYEFNKKYERPMKSWFEVLAVSFTFIVVMVGLACVVFSRRDG